MSALADEIALRERVSELEQTAQRLQRQLAAAKGKNGALVEAVKTAAHEATMIVGRPKPVPLKKRPPGKGHPEEALIHFTDWQLGKRTSSYNTEVCIARVRHVVERVRRITAIQRRDHPVPGCTVMLGGDGLEGGGGIFPGQAFEVDSSSYSQLMTLAGLLVEVVLTLLKDYETVTVYAVHGNHGRIGRRGDLPREDNLDNIAYAIARNQLADQTRVIWEENTGWYANVVIGEYSAMLVHGDQIKGVAGAPMFAIARRGTAWASSMPFAWSDLFLGHYHQAISVTLPSGGQVRMTPSTESGSEYASEFMASRGRPGQRLLFVRPDRGTVTGEYMIWLD